MVPAGTLYLFGIGYSNSCTWYGFNEEFFRLERATLIMVSQSCIVETGTYFLADSIALCMESASMCEWPLSRNLCSITFMCSNVLTMNRRRLAINWFLFCPPQVSENKETSCTLSGSVWNHWNRAKPISQLPFAPFTSAQKYQKPRLGSVGMLLLRQISSPNRGQVSFSPSTSLASEIELFCVQIRW